MVRFPPLALRRPIEQSSVLPLLPALLAPFILLGPLLFSGKALFWGTPLLQFVPWWAQAWSALQSGRLPLWNSLNGMGAPLLANYQSALFYPPTWLYFLLAALGGVPAIAWGQALLVALHLAWAGTGMALLARRLGLNSLAQSISGLAFGCSGYLVARAGFLSINATVSWLPWILLFGYELVEARRKSRPFALLALALAMQLLAGHAQTAWYSLWLALFWTLYWSFQTPGAQAAGKGSAARRSELLQRLKPALLFGLALALAGGLAAVQLLPTAEYLLQSQRAAAVNYELAMTYSTWPWRLLSLFAPDLFGSPAQGDYWGYGNYWEDALYIGLLPVLLALGALLRRSRKKGAANETPASFSYFLLGLILLSLLLALGKNTPVFPWLYRHVPTFSMFQAPARYLIWAEFALVLLAALGAQAWRRPAGWGLYWARLGAAGAFAVTLGAGLAWYLMGDIRPTFLRAAALAGFWGLGASLLSLTAPPGEAAKRQKPPRSVFSGTRLERLAHPFSRAPRPEGAVSQNASAPAESYGWWPAAVVAFIAADLLFAGWGLLPAVDLDVYRSPSSSGAALRARLSGGRLYLPAEDEEQLKFERFLRFDTFNPGEDWHALRFVQLPDANLLDGLPSANNFDPLVPGRFARWMEALGAVDPQDALTQLNLMGVSTIERIDRSSPGGVRFESLGAASRLRWLPCAVSVQDEAQAWQQVWSPTAHLERTVIVEGPIPDEESYCPTAGMKALQPSVDGPNRIVVPVSQPDAGWVLLSDTWYPGWQAQVDGRPAPILHGDYLFRAVQVPAGSHVLTFTYRPVSFWAGLLLSLLSLAGFLLFARLQAW